MNKVGRGRHRHAAPSSTASRRPARPAPPTPIATPGSSATPATSSCGVWFGNDDYSLDQPHDRRLAAGDDLARRSWPMRIRASSSRTFRASRSASRAAGRGRRRECRGSRRGDVAAGPPPVLTRRGADVLVRVEGCMDEAARALRSRAPIAPPADDPRRRAAAAAPTDPLRSARTQGNATASRAALEN